MSAALIGLGAVPATVLGLPCPANLRNGSKPKGTPPKLLHMTPTAQFLLRVVMHTF